VIEREWVKGFAFYVESTTTITRIMGGGIEILFYTFYVSSLYVFR